MKTIEYYNKNANSFVENTINANMETAYEYFLKYIEKNAKILDFGCGSGRDAKFFIEQGYEVDAIDGSYELCQIASKLTGQEVKCMMFNELNENNKYDGIWACSSILHLEIDDLKQVVRLIQKALKPKGILYTSFKYGESRGVRNGRYFTDFNEKTFKQMLKDIKGLEIVETNVTNDVRPSRLDEKWLNVIVRKLG